MMGRGVIVLVESRFFGCFVAKFQKPKSKLDEAEA
jgi:hypothetical protein